MKSSTDPPTYRYGSHIKVSGIALWNTKNEKYGPNIDELEFTAPLKDDTVTWSDPDGYTIVIRFSRKALDVTEHAVGGHFGMNVTFAGHYARTATKYRQTRRKAVSAAAFYPTSG